LGGKLKNSDQSMIIEGFDQRLVVDQLSLTLF
jgi:hypothetical protein